MSVPKDPRVRFLRSQKGTAVRDGKPALAAQIDHELAVIRAERELLAVAARLSAEERNHLASIILAGVTK